MQNQILKDWQKVKLGNFALLNPPVSIHKNEDCLYIPMEDLDWNKKFVNPVVSKEYKGGAKFIEGDILFARITPCLENGKIGRAKGLKDGIGFGSTEYFVIRGKEGISDTNFLYYLCRTHKVRQTAINSMIGTSGRQRANIDSLETYELELPNLAEQKRIAGILSALDDKIEVNNKIAKTLVEMAQAIFKEWIIKNIGDFETKELGSVAINYDRKRKPLSNMERSDIKGIYPYHGATEIMDHINKYIFDGEYLLVAEDGTVETSDGKPVLQFIEGKFWVNNHAHIIQGVAEAPTFYLYLTLKNTYIKPFITGAVQLKLTQENLNKIPIVIPSKQMMDKFTKTVYPMIIKIRKCNLENQKLADMQDLLLPKLMKGEIRV